MGSPNLKSLKSTAIPEISYSSSEDEDFFDAEEDEDDDDESKNFFLNFPSIFLISVTYF